MTAFWFSQCYVMLYLRPYRQSNIHAMQTKTRVLAFLQKAYASTRVFVGRQLRTPPTKTRVLAHTPVHPHTHTLARALSLSQKCIHTRVRALAFTNFAIKAIYHSESLACSATAPQKASHTSSLRPHKLVA